MVSYASRISFTLYDRLFQRRGPLGGVIDPKLIVVHNAPGSGTFTVLRSNPLWSDLNQPGARVIARVDGQRVMSGRVVKRAGDSSDDTGWTFSVIDDFAEVDAMVCLPNPSLPPSAQDRAYDRRTGPAETVVKAVISANSPGGLSVAGTAGRGPTVNASWRFHGVLERLDLTGMGLGLQVLHDPGIGAVRVDVYVPRTIPQMLRFPIVSDWSATWTEPTVTRVIAGSQGQGASRIVRMVTDSALESAWGSGGHPFRRASFIDARDIDTAQADQLAELDQRMADALAKGAPTAGAKVTLADTAAFRFGSASGYRLGDVVTMSLDPALPPVTDLIRSITFTETSTAGFSASPTVGDIALDPSVVPIILAKRLDRRLGALERI